MLTKVKTKFPKLYNCYRDFKRKKLIITTNRIKKNSDKEYPMMLSKQYRKYIGHTLDWNNLVTYTEKMQWEKLYDDNPDKVLLADKYRVRNWVQDKIGSEYLIPLLGAWDNFNDINFNELPNQFVLKTNHGSGTNIIVKDKTNFDIKDTRKKINDWMKIDYGHKQSLELHYSEIVPKIIAEKYIESKYGELQDYKFLCFNGKPYFCWVDMGRYSEHTRNVYDLEWKLQPWNQEKFIHYKNPIPKPKNFDKMIEIAERLSDGFSHVRVDLYNVNGKIYFGEMTFTNGSGFDRILPEKYDKMLGDLWKIDNITKR